MSLICDDFSIIGGAAFSPALLNPTLWLDAATITSIADNDPLSTWTSRDSGGKSFTQTGAGRPTYKVNMLNGWPGVYFTGGKRMVSTSTLGNIMGASEKTCFAVVTPTLMNNQRIIITSQDKWEIEAYNSPSSRFRTVNNDGSYDINNVVATQNNPYIVAAWQTGGRQYMSVNNGAANDVATGSTNGMSVELSLGGWADGQYYYEGYIFEVLAFDANPALDSTKRAAIYDYLYNKYFAVAGRGQGGVGGAAPNNPVGE
jgi:hypothetical protein